MSSKTCRAATSIRVNDENLVVRKNVTLGQRDGVNWVVESGLEDGDRVIVNGVQKVRPNMPVNATPVEAMPHDTPNVRQLGRPGD